MAHLLLRIEQSVVHIDIEQRGAIAHLLAGYAKSLVILFLLYQTQELAAAGHIATLAHIHKCAGQGCKAFEPREPVYFALGRTFARGASLGHLGYGLYVSGR